ncbi:MAG: hypothetical protein ACLFVP_02260 [Candidatus Bathyarchaeia archaeon]
MDSVVRRRLMLALLQETKQSIVPGELKKQMRITGEAFNSILKGLEEEGLITYQDGKIKQDLTQRLRTAIKAVKLGADLERVNRELGWLEFEEMAAFIFEENDFEVLSRFRFKAEGRRWEIDVLSARKPYLICAECKHWTTGMGNSSARRIVEGHLEKTNILIMNINALDEEMPIHGWDRAILIPVILNLSPVSMKIYRRVPVVSVLALPRFIDGFEGQLERLAHFEAELKNAERSGWQARLRLQ